MLFVVHNKISLVVSMKRLMPQLKCLFKNAITPDCKELRGKTMKFISLFGLIVGKEKVCICFMVTCIKSYLAFSL